ncbi:hypothetical protein [Actinotignum sp. GS-2025c]|uniref:hypothetical protein n=1 Tax=Actinotignum sp. GS-2025c TaxID=3427276 RepID=UPI003F484C36
MARAPAARQRRRSTTGSARSRTTHSLTACSLTARFLTACFLTVRSLGIGEGRL